MSETVVLEVTVPDGRGERLREALLDRTRRPCPAAQLEEDVENALLEDAYQRDGANGRAAELEVLDVEPYPIRLEVRP